MFIFEFGNNYSMSSFSSLYDLAISAVSLKNAEGSSPKTNQGWWDLAGSGVIASDYSGTGTSIAEQGTANFTHSIDQSIEGDAHTLSITIGTSDGKSFLESLPEKVMTWDGIELPAVNGLQFDIGNYYRGQYADLNEGLGEVDGLNLDVPWNHYDDVTSFVLTYADGTTVEESISQFDGNFPESEAHTEHDEVYFVPTLPLNLQDDETGKTYGDAVSVTFKENFNVSEEVESNGEVRLFKDGEHIHVQDSTGDWHDVLTPNNEAPTQLLTTLSNSKAGWELKSAEVVDGNNELIFASSDSKKARTYLLDSDWDMTSMKPIKGWGNVKGKKLRRQEDEHQIDINNDNKIKGSDKYDFQVFFAGAKGDHLEALTNSSFSTAAGPNDIAGKGVARYSGGKASYSHNVRKIEDDDTVTIQQTVRPQKGLTFKESISKEESNQISWDGKKFKTNALQFDFGNFWSGPQGSGEVDGIDMDLPWSHSDKVSKLKLTFADGSTHITEYNQALNAFQTAGAADWDEVHFTPTFAFKLPIDSSNPKGKTFGDATKVTFIESFELADIVESSGSIKTAVTDDGGYVQDEDNVWHDITGATDEITDHTATPYSAKSIFDYVLKGAEIVNGVNQLIYTAEDAAGVAGETISVLADDAWAAIEGSAKTIEHTATNAINDLEDAFGIDIDSNKIIGAITDIF